MKYAQLVIILYLVQDSLQQEQIPKAAVATDVPACSEMAKNILEDGGSAVDAAITAVLCVGVVNPQSSGIGGGLSMVVYSDKKAEALMALERAPQAAASTDLNELDNNKFGVKSIAIPTELNGLWAAHKRHGKLEWKQLFEPVIKMAREGCTVTKHLGTISGYSFVKNYPVIKNLLKLEGKRYREGDTMYFTDLAVTLEKIANNGASEFYTGSVGHDIVNDIREAGGIITEEDFCYACNTKATWEPLANTTFKNGFTMYSTPLTASGPVLQYILNIMDEYDISSDTFEADKALLYHRFLEAAKFAWALRSHLGDNPKSRTVKKVLAAMRCKKFARDTKNKINDLTVTFSEEGRKAKEYNQKEDALELELCERDEATVLGDTSHISVLAENGDAVSVTTSVGYFFGSRFYSKSTGVFLNNHMANFYKGTRSPNAIQPGRRFMTTTCPSLLVDSSRNVKMVIGASGGQRIIPANAWDAINEKRVYPFRTSTRDEEGFNVDIRTKLEKMGHVITTGRKSDFAVVQAILKDEDGGITAYSDPRKGGMAAILSSEPTL